MREVFKSFMGGMPPSPPPRDRVWSGLGFDPGWIWSGWGISGGGDLVREGFGSGGIPGFERLIQNKYVYGSDKIDRTDDISFLNILHILLRSSNKYVCVLDTLYIDNTSILYVFIMSIYNNTI